MTYASTDVPRPILDEATVTSTLTVADGFLIGDVNVTLNIRHTFDSDLEVFLIGPDGTRVELFTAVGGFGENFTNTTLDDEAATAISTEAAPFTGIFRPEGRLSDFDGRGVQGVWTLEITDSAAGDVGVLTGWSLTLDDELRDDFGNDFATAQPVTLSPSGSASRAGTIEVEGDVDFFRFVAPVTGLLTVRLGAAGGDLDPYLAAYGPNGQAPIQEDDDSGPGLDSLLHLSVVAGQTYYVQAAAFFGTTGPYTLTFTTTPAEAADNDFATAQPITLSPSDSVSRAGAIEVPGDVDFFRFVAPLTGTLTVGLGAAAGSGLDPYLAAYDRPEASAPLAEDDDSGPGLDSLLQLSVVAGRTYYLRAGAFGETVGGYTLALAPDDFGDDFDMAEPIELRPDGSGSQTGAIGVPGDGDIFRFVAPVTGLLTVRQEAAPGSGLDSLLTAFDSAQAQLARNDDIHFPQNLNSQVQLSVVAGQTHYVQAAAFFGTTGPYTLTFTTTPAEAADNDFATAQPITLSPSDSVSRAGAIEVPGDVDFFRFVAPQTGPLVIRQEAPPGSGLDSLLEVYNDARALLGSNDDFDFPRSLNSQVRLNVDAGQIYYVRAGALRSAVGDYTLTFTFISDDFGDDFAAALPVLPFSSGPTDFSGAIEVAGDVDFFRFVALVTGTLTVRQGAIPGSSLDSFLDIYDASQTLLDTNDDIDFPQNLNSQVHLAVTAGQTLFIRAAASPLAALTDQTTGRYTLTFIMTPAEVEDAENSDNSPPPPPGEPPPGPVVGDVALSSLLLASPGPASGLTGATVSDPRAIPLRFNLVLGSGTADARPASTAPVSPLVHGGGDDRFTTPGPGTQPVESRTASEELGFREDAEALGVADDVVGSLLLGQPTQALVQRLAIVETPAVGEIREMGPTELATEENDEDPWGGFIIGLERAAGVDRPVHTGRSPGRPVHTGRSPGQPVHTGRSPGYGHSVRGGQESGGGQDHLRVEVPDLRLPKVAGDGWPAKDGWDGGSPPFLGAAIPAVLAPEAASGEPGVSATTPEPPPVEAPEDGVYSFDEAETLAALLVLLGGNAVLLCRDRLDNHRARTVPRR
ncbi:MAG TPA: proprotein convertase P-domain-containing protein [Gemmataceae bacterium]|nr:proprotein convertase P-domain-containing protein [Gemmataceae bacterium]